MGYNGLTREVVQAEAVFDGVQKEATKKIKDRGIDWKEAYHDKSATMKKKMDSLVGPMAYIRYQGHDFTTNADYYVVIGPSVDGQQKMFFAGIKKLPRDPEAKVYSPYGEYFDTIKGACAYAQKKWGVPFPSQVPDYSKETLAPIDIPEHIKG